MQQTPPPTTDERSFSDLTDREKELYAKAESWNYYVQFDPAAERYGVFDKETHAGESPLDEGTGSYYTLTLDELDEFLSRPGWDVPHIQPA